MHNGMVYYVHTDHLGTPRVFTDPDTKQVVWRWDGDPFGTTEPNSDPDGDGIQVSYSLRFPGQYSDSESGLYYNWYRHYDPTFSRYVTSDPIGYLGGPNSYWYAAASPVVWFDPLGLVKRGRNLIRGPRPGPNDFRYYGHWCGPGWTGGNWGTWEDVLRGSMPIKPPMDPLDSCCEEHDKRYAGCRKNFGCETNEQAECFRRADRNLSRCASNTRNGGVWRWGLKNIMRSRSPDPESCCL